MDEIQAFDIKGNVVEAVIGFFDTMLSLEAALIDEDPSLDDKGARISGSIGFAGDVVGTYRVEVSDAFARIMTVEMLGMELEDLEGEDEIKDVLLETCNILAGSLKSALNDHGLPCVISTPALTMGNNFDVVTLNMARYERFIFHCSAMGDHQVLVEVCIKLREDALPEAIKKLSNIDVTKFKRLDIISTAGDTLIEMFELMLSMKLETCDAANDLMSQGDRFVASVNFAGDVVGVVSIIVGRAFARIITGKMIDRPLEEVQDDEEIKDVVGEMCNIVGGNLKGGFSDSGLLCEISHPSITTGDNFKIEVLNMARYERFSFRFYDHDIFVEVCVKIDESVVISDTQEDEAENKEAEAPKDSPVAPSPDIEPSPEADAPSGAESGGAVRDIPEIAKQSVMAGGERLETDAVGISNNIDFILDIPIEVTVELGRTRMKIHELRELGPGSSVVFDNIEDEKLEIFANNQLVARGEVVVEKGKYGIRVTEVISRMERIRSLK